MYLIMETQFRPDGIVNVQPVETRQTINSAISYFAERRSKMSMTELYTSVALSILDENLAEVERKIVKTMYKEPTEEPVEEPVEEPQEEPVGEVSGE